MANGVDVVIDTSDFKKLSEKLEACPNITRKAMLSSLNRALSKGISYTATEVQKEYPKIKRKDIAGIAKKQRASYGNLTASLEFTGPRLKASFFPHTISRSKNRSPVTLKIKKSPKTSGSSPVMFGEGTKQRRGANGSREVYKRAAGSRRVSPVYTLSIAQMIGNEEVGTKIQEQLHDDFMKRLEHELDYRLGLLE